MSALAERQTSQAELLKKAREGDSQARAEVLEQNGGLIWSIVRRYFGRGVDVEDLYQLGCIGFIKAIDGFDDAYGTQFSTYAVPKIAGEIRRFLRDDGAIKVSRGLKEQAYAIKRAREAFLAKHGREPTVSELSEVCGLTVQDIAAAELATEPMQSLQGAADEGVALEQTLGNDGIEDALVERMALRQALQTLPERERMVVELRYFRGMTQQNVAKIMGVSQVQVSRIERRSLALLREEMG
ncbi:MAG: sigma-70 family RNA polymerase sigma factor [Oscillospiraceae bacterium]|nr:sigma-70 family RNA polymerase sigma factor [Oscillospiraceae bacterium]